jgi:hypothetical protein
MLDDKIKQEVSKILSVDGIFIFIGNCADAAYRINKYLEDWSE